MRMRNLSQAFTQLLVGIVFLVGGAGTAQSAGFAIIENSASGMGAAFAGAAAISEDASTIYFNPAGLMRLEGTQFVGAAHVIAPDASFDNQGTTTAVGTRISGSGHNASENGYVPNLYISHRINESFGLGLGINAPFGLSTSYDNGWVGRYDALDSSMATLNINPSLAFRANEYFSIGVGLNIQQIEAELANAIDSSAVCLNSPAAAACAGLGLGTLGDVTVDSHQSLTGEDWSLGWNLGILIEPTDYLRFGVHYRSKIHHKLEGRVDFHRSPAFNNLVTGFFPPGNFVDQSATAEVTLPETVSLSMVADVTDKWTVMGDVTWTHWARFDNLIAKFGAAQDQSVIPEDWKNSWRYSLGVRYTPCADKRLVLRGGLAYDESPIKNSTMRTPRIPGNDRVWLSVGAGYRLFDQVNFDFGYTHIFVDDTSIRHVDAFGGMTRGEYEASVDLYSVQMTITF